MKKRNDKGLWAYLDALGVLENGTEDDIKNAKRKYRKGYLLRYKQNQRQEKPEFTVLLDRQTGEYGKIALAAKKHKMSVSAFLRRATLAYIEQKYLVPNTDTIAKLEQLLQECLNEVQRISRTKEKYQHERNSKYEAIEERIELLQEKIDELFRRPAIIEKGSTQGNVS